MHARIFERLVTGKKERDQQGIDRVEPFTDKQNDDAERECHKRVALEHTVFQIEYFHTRYRFPNLLTS